MEINTSHSNNSYFVHISSIGQSQYENINDRIALTTAHDITETKEELGALLLEMLFPPYLVEVGLIIASSVFI